MEKKISNKSLKLIGKSYIKMFQDNQNIDLFDGHKVGAKLKGVYHYLEQIGITDKDQQKEIMDVMSRFYFVDYKVELKKLGWTITGISAKSRLAQTREEQGMTREELSKKINKSIGVIGIYETLDSKIDNAAIETVLTFLNALHCDLDELFEPDRYSANESIYKKVKVVHKK